MENVHELYETPVYNEKTEFGNVEFEDEQDKTEIRKKRLTSYTLNRTEIMKINGQKLERHFIKISMIIDKSQHEILGNDVQRSTDFSEDVVNNIYSKFIPYNVVPAMVQLIIWTDSNPILMPNNYTKVLAETAKYREEVLLLQEPSDITIMITATPFLERWVIGAAYTNAMCDSLRSTNVNYDTKKGNNIPYLATLIAHEISHVLGMFHDNDHKNMNDYNTCDCPCRKSDFAYLPNDYEKPAFCGNDDRCIMYPSLNRDYSYFSLCSRRLLEQGLQEHRCLHEAPKHIVGAAGPVCGNAIIEDGETCDCGSDEDCPLLDPCCEPGTCQLKSSSQCNTGYCCSTEQCQFKPRGETCRHKLDEGCDLEEQCTGTESMCPLDTYKQDGRSCLDSETNSGFCSSGECLTLDRQCKKVYGPLASTGDDDCFAENTKGYWNGNCGYGYVNSVTGEASKYRKCASKDTKCGLLACKIHKDHTELARQNSRDLFGRFTYVQVCIENRRSKDYDYRCGTIRFSRRNVNIEDDESEGLIDFGQVQDYTSCGDGLFCLSNVCTYEAPTQCPSNNGKECDGHGQCNNLNKCQCDVDWGNETCSKYLN